MMIIVPGKKRHCLRSEVKCDGLLDEYCLNSGLLLGQLVLMKRKSALCYFRQYGLSESAFQFIFKGSPLFRWQNCFNGATWKEAIDFYAHDHELEQVWCPKYIHVYEMIGERYTHFSWEIDVERRCVRFSNYPCHKHGELPTLYELVSGLVDIDPDYEFVRPEKRPRHRKVWQPRQRRPMDTWHR